MSSARGSPIRRLQLINKDIPINTSQLFLTQENQRLNSELHLKNLQLQQLYQQNKLLKLKYEDQVSGYEKTLVLMQKQISESEKCREQEFKIIKQRYDKMTLQQTENMKNYHQHQIEFLLKQIAHLRTDATIKEEKLLLKQSQLHAMKESFQRQIQQKIAEVNNLNKKYLVIQQNKNKEIKQISQKRELEKSRTSGLVSSRKENNQFMDKQLRKLNEEVLDKTIKVQSLMRDNNKLKKKLQDTQKTYKKKIEDLITEREEQNKERQAHFLKIEKSLRQQIMEYKAKQLNLLSQIDSMQNQIQSLNAEVKRFQGVCKEKEGQIKEYRSLLDKQREQHANQISRLLKQRKKRSSNLGSSRSLGSSMKDSGQLADNNSGILLKKMDSVRLPIVKQQSPDKSPSKSLQGSRSSGEDQLGEQDHQLSRAVYHYDALIEELKRSHSSEVELLKHKIQKLSKNYQEKQQEVLDILTRFSPLVKIHAQEKSVEQDRKQRIERHWKADLGLLQILLGKYKIKLYD